MKAFLCLAYSGLTLLSFAAGAQEQHTVYYDNGRKAMEGKWRYTGGEYFHKNSILYSIMRDDRPFYGSMARPHIGDAVLNILPEGLVRLWYSAGEPRAEITFVHGVPNGPYKYWNKNGTIAEEGALKDGFPDGEWKAYDDAGRLRYIGHYTAPDQQELNRKWSGIYQDQTRKRSSERTDQPPQEDEAMQKYKKVEMAYGGMFFLEENHIKKESVRNGAFTVVSKTFGNRMKMHYTKGARSGTWELLDRPGHRKITLEFSKGKLAAVIDSAGRRRPIAELIATYKEAPAVEAAPAPQVYRYVEQMPSFGDDLNVYLSKNMQYPQAAKEAGQEGRANVQFTVKQDGSIADAAVVRSTGDSALDAEALRLVREMPRWKPGKQQGLPVDVLFTLPVTFKLQ